VESENCATTQPQCDDRPSFGMAGIKKWIGILQFLFQMVNW